MALVQKLLSPVVEMRKEESTTALLMFAYSFLAMTSYNIVRPITRSKFISGLGADNLPYVQLAAGLLIGVLMHLYSRRSPAAPPVGDSDDAGRRGGAAGAVLVPVPDRRGLGRRWPSTSLGLILGILLISQFWTLANDIYDPRQAKRLFGFIGGGARLGGARAALTSRASETRHRQSAAGERGDFGRLRVLVVVAHPGGANSRRDFAASAPRSGASAAARRSACCARRATCRSSRW